jgi:hypothetical protein
LEVKKFNQALIYYSQIEMDLKNDAVAHEATLKAAKQAISKPILIALKHQRIKWQVPS